MDPRLNPRPEPPSFTGSKLGDRVLGIVVGLAWWPLGIGAAMLSEILVVGVLLLFIGHLVFLSRRPDGRTLVGTIAVTAVVSPLLLVMGLFGMCAFKA